MGDVEPGHLPVVAVVGPTATGKSDLALGLAERLGGEVVGADASQLYRGMDIGTAKVMPSDRRGIPHHQVDVLDVTDEASVAAYQRESRADLEGIRSRGRLPIVAGGSGLYVRAALDRLEIPPTDAAVRRRLELELDERGVEVMFGRLSTLDPVAARAIEPRNGRRVVRALEVVELTGRPFSATMPVRVHLVPTLVLGLRLERTELDRRIDSRVEQMWERGLLTEVERLAEGGLRSGRTARSAVGYSQALAHLDGVLTAPEAVEQTKTATRRLARRQESWFRADPRVCWLPAGAPDLLDQAMGTVREAGRAVREDGR